MRSVLAAVAGSVTPDDSFLGFAAFLLFCVLALVGIVARLRGRRWP